ncbi:FG-GAP-like repeat-containing protein [Leucobacter luti]|uniref:FG-GAP-like repeat-containing protein n=1 Tax=Leucobacter luti TaxID=340320 RepID=UPI001C68D87F|nr:FG-GAP-like repeat-containing protein [Leucobacter luti]QYM77007.1 FG-GAP-like repeat-containing protein [Leucobacter luti]
MELAPHTTRLAAITVSVVLGLSALGGAPALALERTVAPDAPGPSAAVPSMASAPAFQTVLDTVLQNPDTPVTTMPTLVEPDPEPTSDPGVTPDPEPTPEVTPEPSPDPGTTPDPNVMPEAPMPEPADSAEPGSEPRGPNGGIASNSPGPATAKPWDESMQLPLTHANRALIGDNYPQKYKNLPLFPVTWDEWNFAHRQCTSFVSWRLNTANKVKFSNQYMGRYAWGNAAEWAGSARSVGIRVDTTPEVGSVAWSGPYYGGASEFGHVAWVADVLNDGRVVIEEYNNGWAGAYGTRTVPANAFQGYIHIADLTKPFTKTTKPVISGVPLVGGTLTASLSGWSPAPAKVRYRWLANNAVIPGATQQTFQPRLVDFGKRITVETTGDTPGYKPTATTSAATAAVVLPDDNGDGLGDAQSIVPWNTDVTGSGRPAVVGFGARGVQVAVRTSSGLEPARTWVSGFGTANGWTTRSHPRMLADVDGDGKSDVVGFAEDGVYVALSTGSSFGAQARWTAEFGVSGGWTVEHHPRALVDVTGDGRADVVGFASDGVYVGVNTGKSFAPMKKWYAGFGTGNGWSVDRTPRFLQDVNQDGLPDILGISDSGVYVAVNTGSGFAKAQRWSPDFSGNAGWSALHHPRTLADVTGDGLPDVVGFASDGVYVGVNTGKSLRPMTRWSSGFGTMNGWLVGAHPRVLADVTGDGRADLVGFDQNGVTVALSTGSGFGTPARWSGEFGAKSWRVDEQPRVVTDTNGDGRADIVAFSNSGVRVATSTGKSFTSSRLQQAGFGATAGSWGVRYHPRGSSVMTLSQRPTPTLSGQMRVGERLTARVGTWLPAPVHVSTQWLRDGKAISGATGREYTLVPADRSAKISFRVNATKPGFAKASQSSAEFLVAAGTLVSAAPKVSGTPVPGSKLVASVGAWGPGPVTLAFQWNRNGTPIRGANSAEYTLTKADVARRITVTVTGKKTGYTTESRASARVKVPGTPAPPSSPPFADVPKTHPFAREIGWMSTSGLSTGMRQPTGKTKYFPKSAVSREAAAAFLFRLDAQKTYAAPDRPLFLDVSKTHKFVREISWMNETGLTTGIATGKGLQYRPQSPVSREAIAAFLFRLEAPRGYTPPRTSPFADVPTTHKFYREIAWMYDTGMSTGIAQPTGKPKYEPKRAVSREAMAAFLYRLETRA